MDLLVSFVTSLLKYLDFLKYPKIGLIVNKIKGIGIILPKKARIVACNGDIPRAIPTGIAPLTSITGNIAVKITVNSADINLKNSVKSSVMIIHLLNLSRRTN